MSPAVSTLSLNSNSNVFNFGYLMPIQINDDDYICSWNSHSLFIIKTDGTLLVKEYSSVKIIGANVSQTRGFRDVIILREDWTLFRIRFVIKRDYIKSKVSDYSLGEVLRGTLGIQNLTSLPTQALSSLEGEIKKIYTLMSDKIYESGEKLLNYTSFDQLNVLRKESSTIEETQLDHSEENPTLYNDQDCYSGDLEENFDDPPSPLYIHQKISRKNSVNSRFQIDLIKRGQNLPFSFVSPKSSPSIPDVDSMQDGSSTTKDEPEGSNYNAEDDCLQTNKSALVEPDDLVQDDDTTIEQSSFNDSQSRRNASCSVVESFSLDGLELTKKFNQSSASSYGAEIKSNMIREGENIFGLGNISSSDEDEVSKLVDSGPITVNNVPSLINPVNSLEDNNSTDIDSLDNLSEIIIPIREPRPIKHVDWQLAIENTHNSRRLEINRFCASGFSDTETLTYVWLSCVSKNRPKLVYYPDFESLRLPPGNNKSFTVAAIRNKIYLLNSENELWYREGVGEPGLALGPALGLATRWNKISKPKSAPNFVNLSLCSSDQLGWFCDTQGDVWLNKLRTGSWFKISHDSDNQVQVRSIEICPTDSSMVWCIDDQNQLFVRAGIFNTRGDSDEHIAGMAWIPVHTPVEATSIAVTNTSVWILSDQSNRIFKRIGIQPPSSYVGTDWQEIKSPTLIKDSLKDISASLNGDIWLLTQQGSIWQVCDP